MEELLKKYMTLWKSNQNQIPFPVGNHWLKKITSWLNSILLLFFHNLGRTKVYTVKLDSKLSLCHMKMQPPPHKTWCIACLGFCMKVLFCTSSKREVILWCFSKFTWKLEPVRYSIVLFPDQGWIQARARNEEDWQDFWGQPQWVSVEEPCCWKDRHLQN